MFRLKRRYPPNHPHGRKLRVFQINDCSSVINDFTLLYYHVHLSTRLKYATMWYTTPRAASSSQVVTVRPYINSWFAIIVNRVCFHSLTADCRRDCHDKVSNYNTHARALTMYTRKTNLSHRQSVKHNNYNWHVYCLSLEISVVHIILLYIYNERFSTRQSRVFISCRLAYLIRIYLFPCSFYTIVNDLLLLLLILFRRLTRFYIILYYTYREGHVVVNTLKRIWLNCRASFDWRASLSLCIYTIQYVYSIIYVIPFFIIIFRLDDYFNFAC